MNSAGTRPAVAGRAAAGTLRSSGRRSRPLRRGVFPRVPRYRRRAGETSRAGPVSTNLRISLTILSIGFAVEGGGEVYSLLTAGSFLPRVEPALPTSRPS